MSARSTREWIHNSKNWSDIPKNAVAVVSVNWNIWIHQTETELLIKFIQTSNEFWRRTFWTHLKLSFGLHWFVQEIIHKPDQNVGTASVDHNTADFQPDVRKIKARTNQELFPKFQELKQYSWNTVAVVSVNWNIWIHHEKTESANQVYSEGEKFKSSWK